MSREKIAYNKAEILFFELQKAAAKEYVEKIQQAYKKAHELYVDLLSEI